MTVLTGRIGKGLAVADQDQVQGVAWDGTWTCRWCRWGAVSGGRIECRRFPPQVAAAPIMPKVQGLGSLSAAEAGSMVQWVYRSIWPIVEPGQGCGEFDTRPEIVN